MWGLNNNYEAAFRVVQPEYERRDDYQLRRKLCNRLGQRGHWPETLEGWFDRCWGRPTYRMQSCLRACAVVSGSVSLNSRDERSIGPWRSRSTAAACGLPCRPRSIMYLLKCGGVSQHPALCVKYRSRVLGQQEGR
jgi:hypothetical protein